MGGGGGGGGFGNTSGGRSYTIHKDRQDKHIVGTKNYNQQIANGKNPSILTTNPKTLLEKFSGKGVKIEGSKKEWFDAKEVIGKFYDTKTGTYRDTTKGMIHYDDKGNVHIVPANPDGDWGK